jgi:hypothetical protein
VFSSITLPVISGSYAAMVSALSTFFSFTNPCSAKWETADRPRV